MPTAWKDADRGAGAADFRRRDGRLVDEPCADRVFPMNFDLKFGSTRGFSAPGFSVPDLPEASSSFSSSSPSSSLSSSLSSSSSVDSRLPFVFSEETRVLTPGSSSDSSEDSSLECGSCGTGFLSFEGCGVTARDRFSVDASCSFLEVCFDSDTRSFGLRAKFKLDAVLEPGRDDVCEDFRRPSDGLLLLAPVLATTTGFLFEDF